MEARIRVAAIAVMVTVLAYLSRHDVIDDALIYARYIGNAQRGLGLVFNANEHVNALSSPLYSYLVLGMSRGMLGHVLGATAIVSGMSFFVTCVLAERMVPFAGLLLASTGYFYSLVGMETSTFLCLLLVVLFLVKEERSSWVPTIGMLLVLTRFEGAALLVPVGVELYRRRRWPSMVAFVPVGVIASIYLLLNHHWYGAYLPASAGAKFGQGSSGYWGRWPFAFVNTAYQLKGEFLSTVYVVALVALLAIPGILAMRRSSMNRLILPFLTILLSFYLLFNIPGYKWYYAPFICFAMVYACAAIPKTGAWRWAAVGIVLLAAMTAGRRFYVQDARQEQGGYPAIGAWLMEHAPDQVRVEAGEIGTLGWYCPRCYIMDILGLTFPKNAIHIAQHDSRSWLAEDRPDYVVVHRQPWVFEDVVKESSGYEQVPVDFGDNVYLLRRKGYLKGR